MSLTLAICLWIGVLVSLLLGWDIALLIYYNRKEDHISRIHQEYLVPFNDLEEDHARK